MRTDKPLPYDTEAEQVTVDTILSTPKLIEEYRAYLKVECFYNKKYSFLYYAACSLYDLGLKIENNVLNEFIAKSASVLEIQNISGVELNDYFMTINPCVIANFNHYMRRVVDNANRRKLIINLETIQNRAFDESDIKIITNDIDALVCDVKLLQANNYNVFIPNWSNIPDEEEPLAELSNVPVLSSQNFSVITAQHGSGKSSLLEAGCASLINPMSDTLGLRFTADSILYIDTERSRADTHRSWRRFMTRCGFPENSEPPNNIFWENVRGIERLSDRVNYLFSKIDIDNPPKLVKLMVSVILCLM
jgi:hypothetical protein